MKTAKYYLLATLVAGLSAMVACEKMVQEVPEQHNGTILLTTEGFVSEDDTKASVSGNTVQWVDGDKVSLNGNEYTVTVDGSHASVNDENIASVATICGYYNCGVVTNPTTTTPTVTIPSRYRSSYVGGRQLIDLPMAAYRTEASSTLQFKHLTAAIKVTVRNSTGYDGLYVDSVRVKSTFSHHKLCGAVTLGLTAENFGVTSVSGDNISDNAVTVYFDRESIQLGNNDHMEVQVPILPISGSNEITITIFTHNKVNVVMENPSLLPANYEYQRNSTQTPPVLARNQMCTANLKVKYDNSLIIDHSLFGVTYDSNGHVTKLVRFSKSNLFANVSNGTITGYQFADAQYTIGETTDVEHGYSGYTGLQGLFGWGNNLNNARTSKHNNSYGPAAANLSGETDWGSLVSDAKNTWRTPSFLEINYLFGQTGTSPRRPTLDNQVDYFWGFGTVNGQTGLVILPESFTDPKTNNGSEAFEGTKYNESITTYANYSRNIYTAEQWAWMEAAGAVFLPAAGFRSSNSNDKSSDDNITVINSLHHLGSYWTSKYDNQERSYHWFFRDDQATKGLYTDAYEARCLGLSVRHGV